MTSIQQFNDSMLMDGEHQVQFALMDALDAALTESNAASQVRELLSQLADFSDVHFLSEQLLMRQYGYPEYDAHVADHAAMIKQLKRMAEALDSGTGDSEQSGLTALRGMLVRHIGSRDQALHDFLRKISRDRDPAG